MKGNLIIISSPSGGGKGTLIREVLEHIPDIGYSVSLTTRPPRFGEEDGKHYHFVTRERFEEAIQNGEFLEYAEVHGNLYGTSSIQVERMMSAGVDVILEIDVQGAANVRAKLPGVLGIFILPPSFEVLKARLTARATERSEDLELRLRNSIDEVKQYKDFDYVVVNDDLATACRKLGAVILGDRQRRDRQSEVVQGILSSFERSKH